MENTAITVDALKEEDFLIGDIGTKLLFEDDDVKIWDLTLKPGEATPWHKHLMDYMFVVIKAAKARTEYANSEIENQDDVVGRTDYRSKDVPHRLVNMDTKEYKNIVVEFKSTFQPYDGKLFK